MKAYLVTTGTLFALMALIHVWRLIDEWPRLTNDYAFTISVVAIGLVASGLAGWAFKLARALPKNA